MKKIGSGQWTRSIVGCVGMFSVVVSASLAAAQNDVTKLSQAELRKALSAKIRIVQHMALNPVLVQAVRQQNAEKLTQKIINDRDEHWQNSPDSDEFKLGQQGSPAGEFLRTRVTSVGSYSEAFVTDKRGANVAVFPLTGDYNQGDESKWTNSWNDGDGQIFIGEPELDASTGLQAVQISAPVLDRGLTIGVLIVGVTFDYIGDRMK